MNKSISPTNDKRERHGLWEYYYNGKLWYKCFYQNGKEIGYEEISLYLGELDTKKYHL
jgi:hypothetical protein